MFQHDRLNNELTFWQKVKELDYILLTSVLLLSILSLFVSTQQMVVKFFFIQKVILAK